MINSDEYCGVREHVIINFANFIAKMDITNMYIQNPPTSISELHYTLKLLRRNIMVDKNEIVLFETEDKSISLRYR